MVFYYKLMKTKKKKQNTHTKQISFILSQNYYGIHGIHNIYSKYWVFAAWFIVSMFYSVNKEKMVFTQILRNWVSFPFVCVFIIFWFSGVFLNAKFQNASTFFFTGKIRKAKNNWVGAADGTELNGNSERHWTVNFTKCHNFIGEHFSYSHCVICVDHRNVYTFVSGILVQFLSFILLQIHLSRCLNVKFWM